MTFVLSEADYKGLGLQFNNSKKPDSKLPNSGTVHWLPAVLGCGYTHSLELLPGVWLDVIDKEFSQSWALKVPVHDHLVQITVLLSGSVNYDGSYPSLEPKRSYFSGCGISPGYVAWYQQSQHLQGVNIHFTPAVLEQMLADQSPELRQALLCYGDWKKAWFPKVTPTMRAVAQQIIHCPFEGATRRVYLQAKVFELLALQLEEVLAATKQQPASQLKPGTLDCIYQARDLLTVQIENPPSILELAEQVGVCDRTLRRGFRKLFGTTVIGYLTQQRMIRAEQLLREQHNTVAEVANKVGYTHLGHFAAAFKRQFGITPSECIAGQNVSTD
ncbi:MAG TPA: AraC family transcriptional regulator [Trichocoleus sp.]